MYFFESFKPWIQMNSALVGLLQVMANVDELSIFESITELASLGIGWTKSWEPIIGNKYGWNLVFTCKILQTSFTKYWDHINCVMRSLLWVWTRINISIMEEHNFDTFDYTLMNAKVTTIWHFYMHVIQVMDSIGFDVISATFPIMVIIWWYHDNFLTEFSDSNRQFINHNSKSTDCGPLTKFWCGKYNWTKSSLTINWLSSSNWWNHLVLRVIQQVTHHSHQSWV